MMRNKNATRLVPALVAISMALGVPAVGAQDNLELDGDANIESPESPDLTLETSLPPMWSLVYDDGDPFWIWVWSHRPFSTTEAALCGLAVETLRNAGATEAPPDSQPEDEIGHDPMRYHDCRDVRDEATYTAFDDIHAQFSGCFRPYSPGFGPVPYGALTPFAICAGVAEGGCDVVVKHYGLTCLNGLIPDS